MSRSGYTDDYDDDGRRGLYRGAVKSAIRGKRGQAFLREMAAAMDAMPEKRLIAYELIEDGAVCAIGTVGVARGVDMTDLDPEWPERIAKEFNVAAALVREIEFKNDEGSWLCKDETPEQRFIRMREWIASQLRCDRLTPAGGPDDGC